MNCPYCNIEMSAVGLGYGNGWDCPKCHHQEVEMASWKMAGDYEGGINFSCFCKHCNKRQQKNITDGEVAESDANGDSPVPRRRS